MNDDTLNDKKGFKDRDDMMIAYDSPRGATDSGENDRGLLPPIASASKNNKISNKTTVLDQKCEDDELAATIFTTSRSCHQ